MKKPRKCGDCGVVGHTKIQCAGPDIKSKKSNAVTTSDISKLFS